MTSVGSGDATRFVRRRKTSYGVRGNHGFAPMTPGANEAPMPRSRHRCHSSVRCRMAASVLRPHLRVLVFQGLLCARVLSGRQVAESLHLREPAAQPVKELLGVDLTLLD